MERFSLTAEEFLILELIWECKLHPKEEIYVNTDPKNPVNKYVETRENTEPLMAYYKLPINKAHLKDILNSLKEKNVLEDIGNPLQVKFTKKFMRFCITQVTHNVFADGAAIWFKD